MRYVLKYLVYAFFVCLIPLNFIGCSSTNLDQLQPISISNGLSTQEVKFAILNSVYMEKSPRELTNKEQITDNALRAFFGYSYNQVSARRGAWFVEEVRANSVLLGYTQQDYYLRVEYVIEKDRIIQRIDGSKNLKQTENSIHKGALKWLSEMEYRIRRNMGNYSASKAGT